MPMWKSCVRQLTLLLLVYVPFASANNGIVTISVDLHSLQETDSAKLWLPYPVSDEDQQIEVTDLQGNFSDSAIFQEPTHGAHYLFADWQGASRERVLSFSFKVQTRERTLGYLTDKGEPVPVEIKKYLASTPLIPTDGEIREIAERAIDGAQGILAKSRAVYDWVVVNTKRDPSVRGCGVGIVEQTLAKRSGKCADLSSVYVALARAVGIPAREVFGLRLGNGSDQDITDGYHCWAEFYLPGTGWVQVDPSDVRKVMLSQDLDLAQAASYREYFFGTVDGDRIAFEYGGRGIDLVPLQSAGPVNYLMYPYAEVNGRALDYFNPGDFSYSVSYKAQSSL